MNSPDCGDCGEMALLYVVGGYFSKYILLKLLHNKIIIKNNDYVRGYCEQLYANKLENLNG